jgi:hypothetical protein
VQRHRSRGRSFRPCVGRMALVRGPPKARESNPHPMANASAQPRPSASAGRAPQEKPPCQVEMRKQPAGVPRPAVSRQGTVAEAASARLCPRLRQRPAPSAAHPADPLPIGPPRAATRPNRVHRAGFPRTPGKSAASRLPRGRCSRTGDKCAWKPGVGRTLRD